MDRKFIKILIHHRGTEDLREILFFFGGRYRQRKTNLSLRELMIHRVPKAPHGAGVSKIGISRFLKNNLCVLCVLCVSVVKRVSKRLK
jgi:hypothetical protein